MNIIYTNILVFCSDLSSNCRRIFLSSTSWRERQSPSPTPSPSALPPPAHSTAQHRPNINKTKLNTYNIYMCMKKTKQPCFGMRWTYIYLYTGLVLHIYIIYDTIYIYIYIPAAPPLSVVRWQSLRWWQYEVSTTQPWVWWFHRHAAAKENPSLSRDPASQRARCNGPSVSVPSPHSDHDRGDRYKSETVYISKCVRERDGSIEIKKMYR